jgi:hypothetical protein
MKKLLAMALMFAACASPAFAWHHKAKTSKPHYDYRYKAPKSYKLHIHKQKQHKPA